jgi:hypothetical protein
MNERIDQLWGQALDVAVPETYSQLSHSQVLKVKQVFADMIVRECADIAKRNSSEPDPYSENYDAQVAAERKAQEIYDEIMSDFGVEE